MTLDQKRDAGVRQKMLKLKERKAAPLGKPGGTCRLRTTLILL